MRSFPLFMVLVVSAVPSLTLGGLLNELSAADAARIEGGGQVLLTEDLDGMPWPRVRVYQKVNATPDEAMAVFFDYNNASEFVPNCKMSKISREIDPKTFEVDYEVAVPILADEKYTVLNELAREGAGRLRVQWKVLRATSIKQSIGDFVVEPMGDGALVRYTNFVEPSSAAAGLLKGVAIGQMRDTVEALLAQVEERQRTSSAGLAAQVDRLNQALGK